MSSLTIIVPRIGADLDFETTLASVLRYRLPHHQVIAVQGPDQGDEFFLADEVDFLNCSLEPTMGRCLNTALPKVTGEIVNIVLPGVEVSNHWFAHGIRQMKQPGTGCVAVPLVARSDRQEVLSCGLVTTRRMIPRHASSARRQPVGPGCQAGFYSRQLLTKLGPQDESLSDEFFGLDIGLSLAQLGYGCAVVEDHVLTVGDAAWLNPGPSVTIGRDAQRMLQRHRRSDRSAAGDWLAAALEGITSLLHPGRLSQLAGRRAARRKQATDRGFQRHLMMLREQMVSDSHADSPSSESSRRAA